MLKQRRHYLEFNHPSLSKDRQQLHRPSQEQWERKNVADAVIAVVTTAAVAVPVAAVATVVNHAAAVATSVVRVAVIVAIAATIAVMIVVTIVAAVRNPKVRQPRKPNIKQNNLNNANRT